MDNDQTLNPVLGTVVSPFTLRAVGFDPKNAQIVGSTTGSNTKIVKTLLNVYKVCTQNRQRTSTTHKRVDGVKGLGGRASGQTKRMSTNNCLCSNRGIQRPKHSGRNLVRQLHTFYSYGYFRGPLLLCRPPGHGPLPSLSLSIRVFRKSFERSRIWIWTSAKDDSLVEHSTLCGDSTLPPDPI